MPRPPEPEKRDAILDACYAAAREAGSLDLSLAHLAERTGVSARMLVYHFGTREALQRALATRLEAELREHFTAAMRESERRSVGEATLSLWDRISAERSRGVLRLLLDVVHQAQRGDEEARRIAEGEVQAWKHVLAEGIDDPDVAAGLMLMVLGASVDLLSSGDAAGGRRAIQSFVRVNRL